MTDPVRCERRGQVLEITIDRPKANTIDMATSRALGDAFIGYRGRPEGDREAVIEAVLAIAAFAEARRGRLAELDVNPLMVLPRGCGVVVADVMIRMNER